VPALDDSCDRLQRLEERFALGLKEIHFISLMMMMTAALTWITESRLEGRGKAPRKACG